MKRIQLLTLILVFISIRPGISQIFVPTEFENYQPIWTHYSMADSLSIMIQGYTPSGEPLYDDGSLYLVHNIFEQFIQGHLIERIDMETGISDWASYKFFDSLNTREYASEPYIKDNDIHIIVNKETNSPKLFGLSFWFGSILGNRSYDRVSGLEKEFILADSLDPKTAATQITGAIFGNNGAYYPFGEVTKLVQQVSDKIVITDLNALGYKVDSFKYYTGIGAAYSSVLTQFFRILDRELLSFSFMRTDIFSPDKQQINMYKFDFNLSNVTKMNITNSLPEHYEKYDLRSYSNGYFHIVSRPELGNHPQTLTISSFDLQGNLREEVEVDNALYYSLATTTIEEDTTMLICYTKLEEGKEYVYFYKSDGYGRLNLLKKISPKSEDDILLVSKMYFTPDKDLLVHFQHISKKLAAEQQYPPKWANWTLFDAASIGLTTSNKNIENLIDVKLMPNPARDFIRFETEQSFDEVIVYNEVGQTVIRSTQVYDNKIEIEDLRPGIYFCELRNDNISVSSKLRFVKLE